MDQFDYRDGVLHCGSVDLRGVADHFGTPLYVYAQQTLLDHYDRLRDAFASVKSTICFSVKSCQNLAILRLLRDRGAAFDIVSGGELARVLEVGGDPSRIVFAGVGKRDGEIEAALNAGIGWFNVESESELTTIATLAVRSGKTARIAVRVNPNVDPHTHEYTTTGTRETKFGIDWDRVPALFETFRRKPGVTLSGLHVHIGSPVLTVQPYIESITRVLKLADDLSEQGHFIEAVNIGGGFGAHYDGSEAPTARAYAGHIVPLFAGRDVEVLLEPGRCVAANAAVLLTRVLYAKHSGRRRFLIVDASITELLRPALYDAFHFAWPVQPRNGLIPPYRRKDLRLDGTEQVDLVGPVCESGDFLAKDRWLPPAARGDLLSVFSVGAYGFVMSSQYNSRPRAAEVLVDGSAVRLIRRREIYDDLVAPERLT